MKIINLDMDERRIQLKQNKIGEGSSHLWRPDQILDVPIQNLFCLVFAKEFYIYIGGQEIDEITAFITRVKNETIRLQN